MKHARNSVVQADFRPAESSARMVCVRWFTPGRNRRRSAWATAACCGGLGVAVCGRLALHAVVDLDHVADVVHAERNRRRSALCLQADFRPAGSTPRTMWRVWFTPAETDAGPLCVCRRTFGPRGRPPGRCGGCGSRRPKQTPVRLGYRLGTGVLSVRMPFNVLRSTFYVLRSTFYVLRSTFYVLRIGRLPSAVCRGPPTTSVRRLNPSAPNGG